MMRASLCFCLAAATADTRFMQGHADTPVYAGAEDQSGHYELKSAERWSSKVGTPVDDQGPFTMNTNGHKAIASEIASDKTCATLSEQCNPTKGDSLSNDASQGNNCKTVTDANSQQKTFCSDVNDEELMAGKCCKYTREGNVRSTANKEYYPQKTKRCCHNECGTDQQCVHGCNLWIAHSSLNWQTEWRPKLAKKCERTCQMSKDIKKLRSDGVLKATQPLHELEKVNINSVADCQTGCGHFLTCSNK